MDTKRLKALTLKMGADAVGITDLKPFPLRDLSIDLPYSARQTYPAHFLSRQAFRYGKNSRIFFLFEKSGR